MNSIVPALKDRAILAGWIVGLVLAASLIWSFSFSFRLHVLMHATNRALIGMDDTRLLNAPLPRAFQTRELLGGWYTLVGSDSLFLVFAIMRDGILVPHGAEVSADGQILELIPLGYHAWQVLDRIPQGLIDVYARRIEYAFARLGWREDG
ncbi:MAG: hypothetical protein FWB78_03175 [Treponema sp.]|nr:hypothetical protein [Treponema sp.]